MTAMSAAGGGKKIFRQGSTSSRRPPVEKGRWASKGTKPLPDQPSVRFIMGIIITHLCRKVLFIETRVKITLYSLALFFGSLVFDFLPMPRTYMSAKDNFFNVYFMKIGWAWLIFIVGSFVYLTSATYGCGKRTVIQQHMGRLAVGTVLWAVMTKWVFVSIEQATGTCLGKVAILDKWLCVTSGFQWHSFDVSGHAFLLIYMNLVTVEEAQAIVNWDSMQDMIFHEDHHRRGDSTASTGSAGVGDSSSSSSAKLESDPTPKTETALRSLTTTEFYTLKEYFENFTPYIRALFICMTLLSLGCDVLLAGTVVYFHTMPQKVMGGACAMAAWYITYRVAFKNNWPGLPGEGGPFKYQNLKEKPKETQLPKKKPVIVNKSNQPVPMFMGMPLYNSVKKEDKSSRDNLADDTTNNSGAETASRAAPDRTSMPTCRAHRAHASLFR